MNKKLLFLIVFSLFGFGAFAQFSLGLKVGANMSKIKPAYFESGVDKDGIVEAFDKIVQSKSNFNFAFAMSVGGKVFSFQPELAFAKRGAKFSPNLGVTSSISMSYLDVKTLFNIGGGSDYWRVYSQFGFSFNTLLAKKRNNSNGDIIDGSEDFSDDDQRFDIGLVLGLGFKYRLGPGFILINPRYEWGILPFRYSKNSAGLKEYGVINRTFNINLGYLIEF